MTHRGYLRLDGGRGQKLEGISEQTRIARTLLNAVTCRYRVAKLALFP